MLSHRTKEKEKEGLLERERESERGGDECVNVSQLSAEMTSKSLRGAGDQGNQLVNWP